MVGLLTAELSVQAGLGFWPGFALAVISVTLTSMIVERFLRG